MNKTELIEAISAKTGMTRKDSDSALAAVIDSLTEALSAGDKIQLVGFGSFEAKERAARTARNPQTGAAVEVPASRTVQFHPGKALKDAVAK